MVHAEKRDPASLIERYEDIVSAFKKATLYIFSKQFGVNLGCRDLYVKYQHEANDDQHCALTAKINLTSQRCDGAIVVLFTKDVFLKLISRALGEDFEEIDDELKDGACEILNMIFGSARTEINKAGEYHVVMDIPAIVEEGQVPKSSLTPLPAIIIPFNTDFGDFCIQMGFNEGG